MKDIPVGGMTIDRLKDDLVALIPGFKCEPFICSQTQLELLIQTSFCAGRLAGFDEGVATITKPLTQRN